MSQFNGFPERMTFTPLPNVFLAKLLPQISDILELKVTLHCFEMLYRKRGYPKFVTFSELLNDRSLMLGLKTADKPEQALRNALGMATQRGTLIHLALESDGLTEDVYFLNSIRDQQTVKKVQSGELRLTGLKAERPVPVSTDEPPDIFTLYEENIGMLTPLVAEDLREAEKLYPAGWIRDAIKEAVSLNKRNWRYISKILENWSAKGKDNGTYKRDSTKSDPDKYIRGKYGHMVRR